jgi:hypothetical protein
MEIRYNPFKMLGSYVGAFIIYFGIWVFTGDPWKCCKRPCGIGIWVGRSCGDVIKENILLIIFCFLISWGIESLVRKLKH